MHQSDNNGLVSNVKYQYDMVISISLRVELMYIVTDIFKCQAGLFTILFIQMYTRSQATERQKHQTKILVSITQHDNYYHIIFNFIHNLDSLSVLSRLFQSLRSM